MEKQMQKSKTPLVLGILSCVAWLIPIVGILVSVIGIIQSILKLNSYKCKEYKIGLVLGVIGLILTIGNAVAGMLLYNNI